MLLAEMRGGKFGVDTEDGKDDTGNEGGWGTHSPQEE